MAAAYLFHIARNHPFVDGNKRTGAAAAFLFLKSNGFELVASETEFETLVFGVAEGRLTKPEVIAFFERHAHQTN